MRSAWYFIFIYLLGLSVSQAQSMNKEFDKLTFLFIDEKYEKCANMAIKYTEDPELRKDPVPYLYVAMSYFEISKKDELYEKHPEAFKDALKYANKYAKKDKNDTYRKKYEGFFIALKDSANKLAQYLYSQEDYRKAAYVYKYVVRFDPNDPLMLLWQGICDVKAKNVGEGERSLTMAMEQITDSYIPQKEMLWVTSKGFTEYALYMDSKGDYAGKRKGEKLSEKFKKYSPEEIERLKKQEAENNKPKKEVKKFETSQETVEGQKPKILNSSDRANEAKKELESIEEEQKQHTAPKRQVRTFSTDDDDE